MTLIVTLEDLSQKDRALVKKALEAFEEKLKLDEVLAQIRNRVKTYSGRRRRRTNG